MPTNVTPTPHAPNANFATATTAAEFAKMMQLTPEAAVRYMQGRDQMHVTYGWQEMWQGAHASAFTVSRLAQADVLNDLYQALVRSVEGDLSRKDWMRDAKQLLEKNGWWGTSEVINPATGEIVKTRFDSRRLELIFDVNTRTAYAAGKWERIQQTKKTFGYLRYITMDDGRVRPLHKSWHGVVLPVDHSFWNTHYPPNGWRCRCRVVAMREKDVQKALKAQQDSPNVPPALRITTVAPPTPLKVWINKKGDTVKVPDGIDPGWAYNVGKASEKAAKKRAEEKAATLHPAVRRQLEALAVAPMGVRPDLARLPPIPVVYVNVPESNNWNQVRSDAMQVLQKYQHKADTPSDKKPLQLLNEDLGWELSINRKSVSKMAKNPDQSNVDLAAIAALPDLVRWAKRLETHFDVKHENPDVGAVHRFYVPVQIGGILYRVKLTVKEYLQKKNRPEQMVLHALEVQEMSVPNLHTYQKYSSNFQLRPEHSDLGGHKLSIKQLLQGAKLNDGTPLETVLSAQDGAAT